MHIAHYTGSKAAISSKLKKTTLGPSEPVPVKGNRTMCAIMLAFGI